MISRDFLRFCFTLSPGSRVSSASNISISASGVSLRRFNAWSSRASSSSVIGVFSDRAGGLAVLGHFGEDLPSQPLHEELHHLLVRGTQPAGFGRWCRDAGLVLGVLHHLEQHLG